MIFALAANAAAEEEPKRQATERKDALMDKQTTIQSTLKQIAVCAYLIWEEEGRPHGRHEIHWLQAESQLKADRTQNAVVLRRPNPAAPVKPSVIKPFRPKRRNNSNCREVMAA